MTRIIAGTAKGRKLRTPPGDATRPTSDRVREALFSALESRFGSLHGLRLLDLYAGSGAVALEAASRGASGVVAVESDRRTAALISENIRTLGLAVEVRADTVERVLGTAPRDPYDVVFLDPPYPLAAEDVAAVLGLLVDRDWLAPGAAVVVERSRRSVEPAWPDGHGGTRSKKYGDTVLWYLQRAHDDDGQPEE
ncbi:MAG: 16S rRNA (guanine(966)-N(2))-methyltransferase RsmD [Propionibacteriales bacterium]|nr:16S rRNA (guanine(966)-N(2))-methyltransferase RsmD [Propionibacteriales bacterium]